MYYLQILHEYVYIYTVQYLESCYLPHDALFIYYTPITYSYHQFESSASPSFGAIHRTNAVTQLLC